MNIDSIFRAGAVAAALVATVSTSVAAAAQTPEEFLREGVDEVMAIVYDRPGNNQPLSRRVRPVLEKHFDFEGITSRAVGPGWRQLSPEQRKRVTELFSELVLRTYADRFEPSERPKIVFAAKSQLRPNVFEVPSTITYAGQNYAVTYRVHQREGGWRIYDVIIEGVSMINNYRSQFEAVLQKGGADALIKSLEDNLRQAAQPR